MITFIFSIFNRVIVWLGSVLPISPFAAYYRDGVPSDLIGIVDEGLGYLNLVFPVGGMVEIMIAYLSAVIAFLAGRLVLKNTFGRGFKVTKAG